MANFSISVWYPHAILLVWKSSSVSILSLFLHYIVILIIMIRHHLQSNVWSWVRNWRSWKFIHTLCISGYLWEPGSLEIRLHSFAYLFLNCCDRTFTTAALSPIIILSTMITALKFKHVNWTILLSMHRPIFFFLFELAVKSNNFTKLGDRYGICALKTCRVCKRFAVAWRWWTSIGCSKE